MNIKTFALTTFIIGSIVFPVLADSLSFQGYGVWKDDQSNVYVGGTSSDTVLINMSYVDVQHSAVSDKCGVMSFKVKKLDYRVPSIKLDGQWKFLSSSPVVGSKDWTCDKLSGQILPKTSTSIFPSSSVTSVINGTTNTYYIYTGEPLKAYIISYTSFIEKTIKINACGFAVLKHNVFTQYEDYTNILINRSANYVVGQLPQSTGSPICRKGVLTLPSDWVN